MKGLDKYLTTPPDEGCDFDVIFAELYERGLTDEVQNKYAGLLYLMVDYVMSELAEQEQIPEGRVNMRDYLFELENKFAKETAERVIKGFEKYKRIWDGYTELMNKKYKESIRGGDRVYMLRGKMARRVSNLI